MRTQTEIAAFVGFSRPQIQRWLSGGSRPKEQSVRPIFEAFRRFTREYDVYIAAGYRPPPDVEPSDRTTPLAVRLERILGDLPPTQRLRVEALLETDAQNYRALLLPAA